MGMVGIIGKSSLSPAREWSGRIAATSSKESINSQDKIIPTTADSTDISKVLNNHKAAVKAVTDRLMAFLEG
jgi:hypothetical protein